jgi:hypothetical protein
MRGLRNNGLRDLALHTGLGPAEPLWRRVPTRGEDGRRLSDFMMLIPRLRERPSIEQQRRLDAIHSVFGCYRDVVVFADLNIRLNLLWVSVRPQPGVCLAVAAAIKSRVPEAMLVASRVDALRRSGRDA